MTSVEVLAARLEGVMFRPGSDGYRRATSPKNAAAVQHPLAVAQVAGAGDVAACLRWAGENGVNAVPQATGHGAGRELGEDVLLVDTSALDAVEIDADRRVARVGAGALSGAVNAAAWPSGTMVLAGTAPDVGMAGYTFHGGLGWLTRPFGLASAALRAVDHVDGAGRLRRAEAHADDQRDREAMWAFRGGGGVGIAIALEVDLHPVQDLWGGYALWPASRAAEVIGAWGGALERMDSSLTSSIGLLHAPDAPTVPEHLRGHVVVHLSAASVARARAGATLMEVVAALPEPAISTFGACDVERLSGIHLDPPVAVPAWGEGRWLTAGAGPLAAAIVEASGAADDGPLSEVELRHVGAPASTVEGALTSTVGEVLLHAVGASPDAEARRAAQDGLDAVLSACAPADTGRSSAPYRDGHPDAPGALTPIARERLAAVRLAVDPDGVIGIARPLEDG